MEVDPKLFVTCRLCLEDLGQYQIVPSVQQQIKYCFDIEVEPFDGLPQLICLKCKDNLNSFHTVKTTYCEKQINLRNKILKNNEIFNIQQQQDTVSSSQQAPETVEPDPSTSHGTNEYNSKKKNTKKKRLLLPSPSSSDVESEQSFQTSKSQKKKSSKHRGKSSVPWETDYKKLIACKLCNTFWSSRKSHAIHNRSHDLLRVKYKSIIHRQCTVKLIKIDKKPNITGLSDMVVHSSNKIIAPGNSYFYTIYSKDDSTNHNKSDFLQNEDESKCGINESSDEDRIAFKPTQRKRRLISRSSNETVVIESNSNKFLSDDEDSKCTVQNSVEIPLNNDQCINIDDSSDSDSEQGKLENSGKVKQPIEAKLGDYKIIQGIIAMCVNSYHKKNDSGEDDNMLGVNKRKDNVQINNESQLKHKLLSIGRKIINKQGFSCTGLLRYMEHKSLEIVWIAKAQSSHPKDTNYIRILTKLRGDLNLDNDPGWISVSKMPRVKSPNSVPLNNPKVAIPRNPLSMVPVINEHAPTAKIAISMLKTNIQTSQSVNQIQNQTQSDAIPAMLSFVDSNASTSDSKKLLNANPVANPKKLPKKLNIESRSNKTVSQQSVDHTANDENNFCLPIITSTTSLAVPSKEQTQDSDKKSSSTSEETNNTETPVTPRIKVKPASELMSERALDRMKEQATTVSTSDVFVSPIQNVWPQQHAINVLVPNGQQILVTSPPLQILQIPTQQNLNSANTAYQPMSGPITSNTKKECVILDTTDFPNTKTESPIKYVKDLLQLHNIFLLDPKEIVPNEFTCLIKFKVVFKQDYQKDSPVVLCLSLLCNKNNFCFQVRDQNQEIVDLTQVSAYWQWEVLQTYRGDVSNKVLQNARRCSQELFDLTNNFFCLLKSINCRKVLLS